MEKVTKNIITRELIINELKERNNVDSSVLLALFFGSLILCSLFLASCYYLFRFYIWLFLLFFIVFAPIPLLLFVSFIVSLCEKAWLSKGNIEISKRFLSNKSEHYSRRHKKYYLHFEGFDRHMVTESVYRNSSHYDEFYLVHYKNKKVIELVYDTKTYEYRES